MALLSASARAEVERVAGQIEKIETAVEPRFQEHFVAAMGLPHSRDPFPNLAEAVDLPAFEPVRRSRRSHTPRAAS